MEIIVDFSSFNDFLALPPALMMWRMFWTIGWLPTAIVFLWAMFQAWMLYIQQKWGAKQKFVLLAIDIPRGNAQSPKAVENMFAYLAGAHSSPTLIEKYWEGKFQVPFSFEIVSIDGYTQFLVHTPEKYRDLLESGIYGQYPDAEIIEVDDYTKNVPTIYPNDELDVFGAEYILRRNSAYPIKTYKEFEHIFGEPETTFRDPMAALMDLCSSLKHGEQLWYQLLVYPIGFDWPSVGEREISKVIGEKVKVKDNIFDKILGWILDIVGEFTGIFLISAPEEKKEEPPFKMMNLKPEQKRRVEMIQEKVGKLGLEFKIRVVYVSKKEVMNKYKVFSGVTGFMKQFAWNDLNNLKPDMDITGTKPEYFFKNYRATIRKIKLVAHYKNRSRKGRNPGIMNVEELASIWHFPIESVVKAPLIQKAPGRKAVPPTSLPISEEVGRVMIDESIFGPAPKSADASPFASEPKPPVAIEKIMPPPNLPIV